MKRSVALISSSALLATALTAGLAMAAPQGRDPGQGLDSMSQRLDLSETQQAEIATLLEQQQQARAAERQAWREQVDAILTDEQRQIRDAQMEERMDRRISRMKQRLDLTADQAAQMRELFAENRANPGLTRSEKRERVAAVLSEDQLVQLEPGRPGKRDCGRWGRGGPISDN